MATASMDLSADHNQISTTNNPSNNREITNLNVEKKLVSSQITLSNNLPSSLREGASNFSSNPVKQKAVNADMTESNSDKRRVSSQISSYNKPSTIPREGFSNVREKFNKEVSVPKQQYGSGKVSCDQFCLLQKHKNMHNEVVSHI